MTAQAQPIAVDDSPTEAIDTFACFGSTCTALVSGAGREGSPQQAVARARTALLAWHDRFSRFLPTSELSRMNADPRERVEVTPLMARLAQAAITAGALTGGLVDATLLAEIETAGYTKDLGEPLALERALALAPPRAPARPSRTPGWNRIEVDLGAPSIARPPSLGLDSGGLAKGLFADILAERLGTHDAFAIGCAGDLALGGSAGTMRPVNVESPFDGSVLHTFHLSRGGVATSGIGRRSWLDADGRPVHHLLDPSTGRAAFTGVVQATALAPTALMAEIYAKAAILSGPEGARGWLTHGGAIVFDDGSFEAIAPPVAVEASQLASFLPRQSAAAAGVAG
jgi:thiamine biosynthesis lipoprotein